MVAKKLGRSAEILNTTYTGGNLTWVGDTSVGTAGENITVGHVVFLNRATNTWLKAKADYTSTLEGLLGIATETIASGATGTILRNGIFRYDTLAMTANAEYFVSEATAGALTASVPVSTAALIRSVGYAQSAGVLVFNPEDNYHYEYLAAQKNFGDAGVNYTLSQDNNGVERKFFKDDFSNDTLGQYTVTGSPTIASGVLTLVIEEYIKKSLSETSNIGVFSTVFQFDSAYSTVTQRVYLYMGLASGATSYLRVSREAGNNIRLFLFLNGSTSVTDFSTGYTLADSTPLYVEIAISETTYTIRLVGTSTPFSQGYAKTTRILSPCIGVGSSGASATDNTITVNELTYTPSVAYTDTCAADNTARYAQVTGTAMAFNTNKYDLSPTTFAYNRVRLKSYQNKEGSRKLKISTPASNNSEGDCIMVGTAETGDLLKGCRFGVLRGATDSYTPFFCRDLAVGSASDTLQHSNDAEVTTGATSYELLKTINIPAYFTASRMRITFDIETAGGGATAYGKIYKNGVAFGTEQTDVTGSYVTKTEDVAVNITGGDRIQIYGYTSDADQSVHIQNFRIYYTIAATTPVVTGTAITTLDNKDVIFEIERDPSHGELWFYVYDNATVKPTTHTIKVFDSTYQYGYLGVIVFNGYTNTQVFSIKNIEVRANLLIGETNIPATETGFYFRDDASVDSSGRYVTTGVWSVSEGLINCTTAGNLTLPFQTTIGVHTFTPTLADGTDYYYFGGYRIKFVASGGNSCAVTLETTAGVAQGTGSLTITTTAGLFANPIVITETATAITVTVTGSGGTPIVSGTTTSTNAYPKFTVGTATCSFDNYSFAGTRYYMKPMLRGAQIGEYWDGTQVVPATRFVDDFNWDTSGEWIRVGTTTFDTTNGYLISGASNSGIRTGQKYSNGFISETFVTATAGEQSAISFRDDMAGTFMTTNSGTKYLIYVGTPTSIYLYKIVSGTGTNIGVGTIAISANVPYKISVRFIDSNIVVYFNDNAVISAADTAIPSGNYIGVGIRTKVLSNVNILGSTINALESTSTNGISATLGGVPHGARYDIAESALISGTPSQLGISGKYIGGANCKTTSTASTKYIRHNMLNSTDAKTLALDSNDYTAGTTVTPTTSYSIARRQPIGVPAISDANDTLHLKVIRDTTAIALDNHPATFINGFSFRSESEDTTKPVENYIKVTSTTQTIVTDTNYIADAATLLTFTLPATAQVGTKISIMGSGVGMWKVAQNALQNIRVATGISTTGTGGYIAASNRYDCIELVCTVANTSWVATSVVGSITVV
jgi:hypothetical protein